MVGNSSTYGEEFNVWDCFIVHYSTFSNACLWGQSKTPCLINPTISKAHVVDWTGGLTSPYLKGTSPSSRVSATALIHDTV
ncbi:hypothetical protein V6N12_033896 [Hibiscus sabdariffa]|uniref:Uncharacterized protein n=1 Tax=Hibiscus sabdariffa TaxID=183260 RepID=A0ABR2AEW9_9ROSI